MFNWFCKNEKEKKRIYRDLIDTYKRHLDLSHDDMYKLEVYNLYIRRNLQIYNSFIKSIDISDDGMETLRMLLKESREKYDSQLSDD